jgi:hypothetical protein
MTRNAIPRPKLTRAAILRWADAYRVRMGRWPTRRAGLIPERPGLTWLAVDQSLRLGHHGLPAGSSLARLLQERRGRRHKHEQPRLTEEVILGWADAWHRRTGHWPGVLSGEIPGTGGEVWKRVNYALYIGLRACRAGTASSGCWSGPAAAADLGPTAPCPLRSLPPEPVTRQLRRRGMLECGGRDGDRELTGSHLDNSDTQSYLGQFRRRV